MAVSYKRLWKLLVDKEMSKSDLRKKAEIAPNTMTKLRRDEEVSLTILSKICKTLHADFGDIVEYVPDAEIWDLYNENREFLGKDHIRGEQLPIDGYHLVVHVWIRNSKGEYLISQRSANRPTYPLMWECVGGSVVKGEDSLQGAIREAKEEVGVDLLPENGQVLFTKTRKIIDGKIFNDIMDVWLFEYDGEVDLSNATTDEVAQVAWMNRSQIKELFDANMFVDTLEYFFTEVEKETIKVKDVKGYNRASGLLFIIYGIIFVILGIPLLDGQNTPYVLLSVIGVMVETIVIMAAYSLVIVKKYEEK